MEVQSSEFAETMRIIESLIRDKELALVEQRKLLEERDRQEDEESYQSCMINEISAALAKAQGEFDDIHKNRQYGGKNFSFDYADLNCILKTVRKTLSKNDLAIYQYVKLGKSGDMQLITKLTHSSGQWISSRLRIMPDDNTMQSLGKSMTYLRRYSICALVGVAPADDIDDDDGAFQEKPFGLPKKKPEAVIAKNEISHFLSESEIKEIEIELDGYPDITEQILKGFGVNYVTDIPKKYYYGTLDRIRKLKTGYNSIQEKV